MMFCRRAPSRLSGVFSSRFYGRTATATAPTYLFIGAGKMAEAMISPLVKSPLKPEVRINDTSEASALRVSSAFSVKNCVDLSEACDDVDIIIVAVKPQNCEDLFSDLAPVLKGLRTAPVILSICAGVPIDSFSRGLSTDKIIRSMPNTPATIGEGMCVWSVNNV